MLTKFINQHKLYIRKLGLLGLGLIAMSGAGCSGDIQPVVVVRLSKVSTSDTGVRFISSLDGALNHTTLFNVSLSASFGLRLPAGSKGTFSVTAEVLNSTNCVKSRGSNTNIAVDGNQERVDADVVMFDVNPPQC